MMIWVLEKREGKVLVSLAEAVRTVEEKLMDHWIWSYVYTVKLQNIQNQIKKLRKTGCTKRTRCLALG